MGDLTTASAQGNWQLSLFGDFRLTDPQGLPHHLPNRKIEGLLAVLAVHRKYGLERDEIGEILWPKRPVENQRASLRQALSQLRRAIGEDSVEGSRTHIRLSSSIQIDSDYDRQSDQRPAGFMPGHEGQWFEEMRLEEGLQDAAPQEPTPSIVGHFLQTLNWFAANDPRAMFAMLRATPAMAQGINNSGMLSLLNTAGDREDCVGWASFWRGQSEDDLQVCARQLRRALREAKRTDNLELASEACLELGKVYSRTGDFEKAQRICAIANAVAAEARAKTAKANAMRLEGTVLLHWGNQIEGLEFLSRSEDLVDDVTERAICQTVRAFYEASVGQYEKARNTLQWPQKTSRELGHYRIDVVSLMTRGILATAGGCRYTAVAELEDVGARCYSSGTTQMGVYADELLAKLLYLGGDKGLAQRKLVAAKAARERSQMVMTPLEAKRVAAVR